ncbi:hypothetical protein [Amycolatopsis sp. YIM 10]|uniref:hypothetical protein n=1 Tax=Amycolatopsis sp. YIM 10 TaxID=2653857 RepID=UPI00128FF01D|nr:hypothetical protein [Amycolatopsis sp. YIM 10]QFU87857.1 hypothetical protein YIM_13355 [Amycolatopsis sp. YIM 10]QFU94830.1 hypothetical protein YIM_48525 [Amycolatopsis sp. YIM 10]
MSHTDAIKQAVEQAGYTVVEVTGPGVEVLALHLAGRLGYVKPSDEWVDGLEPLPDEHQVAAHILRDAGLLPEFEL